MASEGFTFARFFLRLYDLNSAYGIKLFEIKKTEKHKTRLKTIKPLIDLIRDIPDDFIAANS
jgi:hypothetical protein